MHSLPNMDCQDRPHLRLRHKSNWNTRLIEIPIIATENFENGLHSRVKVKYVQVGYDRGTFGMPDLLSTRQAQMLNHDKMIRTDSRT